MKLEEFHLLPIEQQKYLIQNLIVDSQVSEQVPLHLFKVLYIY